VAELGGKWGFADEGGDFCIAPVWDEALEFRGGEAAVRLGSLWHLVDRQGNLSAIGLSRDEIHRHIVTFR
jgi:hypothetical protein